MKAANVALLALAGMVLTSVSVYSLTPAPGAEPVREAAPETAAATDPGAPDKSQFRDGKTLTVEGRLGHRRLLQGGAGETFLLLEVRGEGGEAARAAAPVNLSLVIDRSGSMAGTRMQNAIRAAMGAVDRMNDGDVVSVIAFDTRALIAVPPTTVDATTRPRIADGIRGIALGGDTCISCGIEEGLLALERTPAGRINKMIVLSDGDTNNGVLDVPGFRNLARRVFARGATVTTIGVDVSYNEKILSAIAQESNGHHYFVENDASLSRIFEAEAAAATTAIASGAEAAIDLAPGVEVVQVFDRTFRRSGSRVSVPLGTFTKGDVKTVLLKVRVPTGTQGEAAVARASLAYRDLTEDKQGECAGALALQIAGGDGRDDPLDAVVAGRVSRSETASALSEANALFEQGRVDEARRRLDTQTRNLQTSSGVALGAAPADRKGDVDRDFNTQLEDVNRANKEFSAPAATAGTPPQASRPGKAAVRKNAQRVFEAGL